MKIKLMVEDEYKISGKIFCNESILSECITINRDILKYTLDRMSHEMVNEIYGKLKSEKYE